MRNPQTARPNDRFGPWIPDFDKNRFENREFQIVEQIPNWSVSTNSEICFEQTNKIFEMSYDSRAPPYFQGGACFIAHFKNRVPFKYVAFRKQNLIGTFLVSYSRIWIEKPEKYIISK